MEATFPLETDQLVDVAIPAACPPTAEPHLFLVVDPNPEAWLAVFVERAIRAVEISPDLAELHAEKLLDELNLLVQVGDGF